MSRFLLDLTATAFAADYFLVEITQDGHITGYIVMGSARLPGEESVVIDTYTRYAARETWKQFLQGGGRRINPQTAAFDYALEDALCRDGKCEHYVCTEGRSLDEWAEPEPTRWDYVSEAFGPSAEMGVDEERAWRP